MSLDNEDWTNDVPFSCGGDDPEPTHEQAAGAADVLPESEPPIDFPRVSIADIYSSPSPEPAFIWAGRIPLGHVTLLGAHGGVGKSMMALQLAVAVCLGADFLGASTEQGRVLFFSGEDGAAVLRHRLGYIAAHFNAGPERLARSLTILDATEEPALYREVSQFGIKTGEPTPGFNRLAETIAEVRPSLVIVDNASDVFEASENDRASVRGFMRSLRRLFPAGTEPPAMLLLAHIQKQAVGGRGSESYSGSTAWHNSARSRLALTADRDDPTRLTLSHDKLNLGPRTAEPLRLVRSHTGLLMVDEGAHDAEEGTKEPPELLLLKMLSDFVERGERISPEPRAHSNPWLMLHQEPEFPRRVYRNPGALISAFRQMERDHLVEKETYKDAYRKTRVAWTLSAKGWESIGKVAPSAPSAPSYDENAENADRHEVAPSAPSYGPRGYGGESARTFGADEDANLPDSPMAEKSVCLRCDNEGCGFCQPPEGTRADGPQAVPQL